MAVPTEAGPCLHFLVEPNAPGQAGTAALLRLEQQIRSTSGASARRPPTDPTRTTPRLRISVPPDAIAALQAEFADILRFEPDAELRF